MLEAAAWHTAMCSWYNFRKFITLLVLLLVSYQLLISFCCKANRSNPLLMLLFFFFVRCFCCVCIYDFTFFFAGFYGCHCECDVDFGVQMSTHCDSTTKILCFRKIRNDFFLLFSNDLRFLPARCNGDLRTLNEHKMKAIKGQKETAFMPRFHFISLPWWNMNSENAEQLI